MQGKIVILGAGHVGSHVARALAASQTGSEIVLVDCVPGKADAQAMDIADALSFPSISVKVRSGSCKDCADADVTVVAIGRPREPGQTRLDLLDSSVRMIHELADELRCSPPGGLVISITNPCDIVADCLRKLLGMERTRVFGTGTLLDTARLLRILSEQTGVPRDRIQACVLGEHGDSSMIPISAIRLDGRLPAELPGFDGAQALLRTHEVGMDIINLKGSTEFGIGQCTAFLIHSLLSDSGKVLPLSVLLQGEYGLHGIHCGVPCRVGREGIAEIVELPLTGEEQLDLSRSAAVIEKHILLADQLIAGM